MKNIIALIVVLSFAISSFAQERKTIYVWLDGNYTAMESDSVTFSKPDESSYDDDFHPGIFETNDGRLVRLLSTQQTAFTYDSEGRVAQCTDDEEVYTFSYDPLSINYSEGRDNVSVTNIEVNEQGYITSYSLSSSSYITNYGTERLTATCTFEYDADGHITKMNSDYNWDDDDISTVTKIFTWNNGILEKMSRTGHGDPEDNTFSYDSQIPNETQQWTRNYLGSDKNGDDEFGYSVINFLFYLGYLGKAGNYHPTSSVNVRYGDYSNETYVYQYSTSINSDGSVNQTGCSENDKSWERFNFTYENIGE